MFREVCVENLTSIERMLQAGVDRVELCDNLYVGGTTPSLGVIEQAREITKRYKKELAVIIRARGGDFKYKDFEKYAMFQDIVYAAKAGVDRLVIGALKDSEKVKRGKSIGLEADYNWIFLAIRKAKNIKSDMKFTFHMAFDHIESVKMRVEAIEKLSQLGNDTILTHGSKSKNDIFENVDNITEYIKRAKDVNMTIMLGGGVDYEKSIELYKNIPNLTHVHGTRIVEGIWLNM